MGIMFLVFRVTEQYSQVGFGSHGTNSQNWPHVDFNWNKSSCSKTNPLLAVSKL
jgi:hypothetical protein